MDIICIDWPVDSISFLLAAGLGNTINSEAGYDDGWFVNSSYLHSYVTANSAWSMIKSPVYFCVSMVCQKISYSSMVLVKSFMAGCFGIVLVHYVQVDKK